MLRDLTPKPRRLQAGERVIDREGTEFVVTSVGMKIVHVKLPGQNSETFRFARDLTLIPPKGPVGRESTPTLEEEFLGDA